MSTAFAVKILYENTSVVCYTKMNVYKLQITQKDHQPLFLFINDTPVLKNFIQLLVRNKGDIQLGLHYFSHALQQILIDPLNVCIMDEIGNTSNDIADEIVKWILDSQHVYKDLNV